MFDLVVNFASHKRQANSFFCVPVCTLTWRFSEVCPENDFWHVWLCTFLHELPYVFLKPVGSRISCCICYTCPLHSTFHGNLHPLLLGKTCDIFCIYIVQSHNLHPPLPSVLQFSNPEKSEKTLWHIHILVGYLASKYLDFCASNSIKHLNWGWRIFSLNNYTLIISIYKILQQSSEKLCKNLDAYPYMLSHHHAIVVRAQQLDSVLIHCSSEHCTAITASILTRGPIVHILLLLLIRSL